MPAEPVRAISLACLRTCLVPGRHCQSFPRDHRLVSTRAEIDAVEIKADEQFSVYQTNGVWRLTPANFAPDTFLVKELLSNLMEMQISEFTKDVVTEADLPHYGLASAAHEYILKSEPAKVAAGSSNATVAHLKFGTTNQGKVYIRRTDEIPVYAVELGALQRLPSAAFQLRDRQVWQFTEDDVATATVRSGAKARQFISRGGHHWTLAAGSQGMYNSLAVDQTIRGLGQTLVSGWVARGAQNRARFGFVENGNSVTLELKKGEKLVLEYAGQSSTGFPYGGINLDGEFWIFEMPPLMARDVVNYLSIPADAP